MTVLAQRLGSTLDSILEVLDGAGRPVPRVVARPRLADIGHAQ